MMVLVVGQNDVDNLISKSGLSIGVTEDET